MATSPTALVRRMPPPPPLPASFAELNRWLIDLSAIISDNGGIDPSQVPGTVLNGVGPPSNTIGVDGNLYFDTAGANIVLQLGILAEGAGLPDGSNTFLYAKSGGSWFLIS